MALKGDLASVDLAQVFQMLALNQKVGILSIQGPRAWKALFFDPRGCTLFYNEYVLLDRVLQQMTRQGRISQESVQEGRDHSARHGTGVVEALLAGGYLDEEDLNLSIQTELEEEIYDLFFWRDASFEFFEGATTVEGREGVVNDSYFFSTDSMIMEAARRIDEWGHIQAVVEGPLEVYTLSDQQGAAMDTAEWILPVFDLIDGKRNVARLTEITGMASFLVYKALANLLEEGLIVEVHPDDLVPIAQECVDERRNQDAINLYEKAISLGVGIPESHEQVAVVYEESEEFELAGYHHKCVSEFYAGIEKLDGAVKILRHVITILPTDLAARERLVELTVGRPDLGDSDFDPVKHGKELVDLYLEIGEVDRVRGILERLLRDNPYDLELKKSLISVHSRAGDTKRVVELYESIAEDLVQNRRPIDAVKYLQKIVMLDRSRKDISERIRSLYEMDERRRSRKRSLASLGALFVILTALGCVWYFYELHARERYQTLEPVVQQFLDSDNFGQAKTRVASFIENFPLTIVSREAGSELARIESLHLSFTAAADSKKAARKEELKRLRQQYKLAWKVSDSLKQLDQVLKSKQAVEALVKEAGENVDLAWADKVLLKKSIRDLETYISTAAALSRTARTKLDNGQWQAARADLQKLVKDFSMTRRAQSAELPVMIETRPAGAEILLGGKPLTKKDAGMDVSVRTPALVFIKPGATVAYELRHEGFETLRAEVSSTRDDVVTKIMTVIPKQVFHYKARVRTAVSVSRGLLATGLRGGKIVISSMTTGKKLHSVELGGLDDVAGAPQIAQDRFFYRTKDGFVACHSLADGKMRWRFRVTQTLIHEPVIRDGRVIITDNQGRIAAFDSSHGKSLWQKVLDGEPVGGPVVDGRFIRIALANGVIFVIDASNGKVARRIKTGARIATPVLFHNGAVAFVTDSGKVIAMREQTRQILWEYQLETETHSSGFTQAEESLYVLDKRGGKLLKLGWRDGEVESSVEFSGLVEGLPVITSGSVYVTVRSEDRRAKTESDTLLALSQGDLKTLWEYRDGGTFAGSVSTDGVSAFLPDSKGDVLHFR